MKIPVFILSSVLFVVIGLQSWTLLSIVELKVKMASLEAQMMFTNHITAKN